MDVATFAARLNGQQYGAEISRDEERLAKDNGLVVVFGYSDDCMELRGAIDDELGCFDGGVFRLSQRGIWPVSDGCTEPLDGGWIKAVWCDSAVGAAWSYQTPVPHAEFNIYEGDEIFCIGIVFALADAPSV